MGKLYANQTVLKIYFELEADITGGTVVIKGVNPENANMPELPVTVLDAVTGSLLYTSTPTSDFPQAGKYKLWAKVTFSDGRIIYGEPSIITFYEEGR